MIPLNSLSLPSSNGIGLIAYKRKMIVKIANLVTLVEAKKML